MLINSSPAIPLMSTSSRKVENTKFSYFNQMPELQFITLSKANVMGNVYFLHDHFKSCHPFLVSPILEQTLFGVNHYVSNIPIIKRI